MNPKDYTPRRGKDKEALREYAHKFRKRVRAYPGKPVRALRQMFEKEVSQTEKTYQGQSQKMQGEGYPCSTGNRDIILILDSNHSEFVVHSVE